MITNTFISFTKLYILFFKNIYKKYGSYPVDQGHVWEGFTSKKIEFVTASSIQTSLILRALALEKKLKLGMSLMKFMKPLWWCFTDIVFTSSRKVAQKIPTISPVTQYTARFSRDTPLIIKGN
jgi:hypothetical protein